MILDLDETLIFTSQVWVNKDSFKIEGLQKGFLNQRPFLNQFLEETSKIFNLILFTASDAHYAGQILKIIDPFDKYFIVKLYR